MFIIVYSLCVFFLSWNIFFLLLDIFFFIKCDYLEKKKRTEKQYIQQAIQIGI